MNHPYVSGWCGVPDPTEGHGRCTGQYVNGTKAAKPVTMCSCGCHKAQLRLGEK